jgi:hypothetical protein
MLQAPAGPPPYPPSRGADGQEAAAAGGTWALPACQATVEEVSARGRRGGRPVLAAMPSVESVSAMIDKVACLLDAAACL